VLLQLSKILHGFLIVRGTQAFVVLDLAALEPIGFVFNPLFVVCNREEALSDFPQFHLDDRRHELLEEARDFEQAGPEVVDKVDEKAFDVRAVVVLVRHYHYRAVAQVFDIGVGLSHVEPHNLDHVLQFIVFQDHTCGGVTHIHEFTFEREDTVLVSAYDLDTSHSESLGRVTLC